jgi:hypothetical protein
LLQLEVAKILLHDVGHGHAEGGSEVLGGHLLLLFRILEKSDQAICQVLIIPRLIELDRELLSFRHLAEVWDVGAYDRDTVCAGQVSDSTAAGG